MVCEFTNPRILLADQIYVDEKMSSLVQKSSVSFTIGTTSVGSMKDQLLTTFKDVQTVILMRRLLECEIWLILIQRRERLHQRFLHLSVFCSLSLQITL